MYTSIHAAAGRLAAALVLAGLLCATALPQLARADTLRFGVLTIAKPAQTLALWQPFVDYLAAQLGEPVELVVPRGFERMRQAVVDGEVDLFFVNTYVLYRLEQDGRAHGIAQMENIDGEVVSRSQIFVRNDADIRDIDDLKGKRIAFLSPMGAGGYLAPRAWLYRHGVNTAEDGEEIFTANLSNSIYNVLLGDADAGVMCGINYRLMSEKMDTGELRVLTVSEDYPEGVIGARDGIDPARVERARDVILAMRDTPQGAQVLRGLHSMKVGRFLPYDPSIRDTIGALIDQARLE